MRNFKGVKISSHLIIDSFEFVAFLEQSRAWMMMTHKKKPSTKYKQGL